MPIAGRKVGYTYAVLHQVPYLAVVVHDVPYMLAMYKQRADVSDLQHLTCLLHVYATAEDVANDPNLMFQQLAKTVLQQSCLCPLPLQVQPVHWAHDSALQVYPLPHAVVLADASPPASFAHEGCTVFNPVSCRVCCMEVLVAFHRR